MIKNEYPESIRQRITDEFLSTFIKELNEVFKDELPENPTYYNFYELRDNSNGFYKALKLACEKLDFMDLYDYLQELGCFFNEVLGGKLTEMACDRGIINEGKLEDVYPDLYRFILPDIYNDILETT